MLKKYILFLLVLFSAFTSKAQIEDHYNQYSIGVGLSYIRGYTNIPSQENHFAQNANFTYYYSAYIPITFEVQKGVLSGGGVTIDKYGRQYTNNYLAGMFHGDLQVGQLDPENSFKDFYVGTGFGLIHDDDVVQRTSPLPPTDYVFPGTDHSINLIVPLRIGYELKIMNAFDEPFIRVNFSYEHNVVFGQGLDGYNDPSSKFKHNFLNQYRQISIGLKFGFGSSASKY
jgi:hypothetical protein